jgi:RsiW-degrading membrane proteinase PrsW (M82 family)
VDILITLGYAFIGGVLPSLVWLYILLREDARCPEPRSMVALAFIVGMIAVPLVIPLEQAAVTHFMSTTSLSVITSWALIEETAKYGLAAFIILWRRQVNESVDYVIYMLTIALGFAALENTFFIFGPFSHGQFISGLETGNLRFIGSTLVHVISSSAIGFSMAFSYMKSPQVRVIYSTVGLILAVALHAFFNFLILNGGDTSRLEAFFTIWTGAIVFFALFEILKYVRYNKLPKNTC